jgi:glutathione S-transferase
MPVLAMRLLLGRLPEDVAGPVRIGLIEPQIALHVDYWEAELGQATWFAGEAFSAADIMMAFPVEIVARRLGLGPDRPRLQAFIERIRGRPAYRIATDRAAPIPSRA